MLCTSRILWISPKVSRSLSAAAAASVHTELRRRRREPDRCTFAGKFVEKSCFIVLNIESTEAGCSCCKKGVHQHICMSL